MMKKKRKNRTEVLILLSGGIDSSACIGFYLAQKCKVHALFVNYGQASASKEYKAAQGVSSHYDIDLERIRCTGLGPWEEGFIRGRNAFLLFAALMHFKWETGIIAVGVHSGTSYADCSAEFVSDLQSVFDLYSDGRIAIGTPFIEWDKKTIWDFCKKKKVPVDLTYSCELGRKQPCGHCLSCKDIEALYASEK